MMLTTSPVSQALQMRIQQLVACQHAGAAKQNKLHGLNFVPCGNALLTFPFREGLYEFGGIRYLMTAESPQQLQLSLGLPRLPEQLLGELAGPSCLQEMGSLFEGVATLVTPPVDSYQVHLTLKKGRHLYCFIESNECVMPYCSKLCACCGLGDAGGGHSAAVQASFSGL
jgi:hypothetical protein